MLTIAICDDEARILPELRGKIEKVLKEKKLEAEFYLYDSCEKLWDEFEQRSIDFLFLDIDLPGMSGFDLAKKLTLEKSRALLVFVTNQDALVYESFSFHPFAFIRKAYFEQEIGTVLERMLSEYQKVPEFYSFHAGTEVTKLSIQTMMYFEADGNYVRLVTTKGEYRIRETLGNLSEQLEQAGFIRIHKGFLVNQLFILTIRQNEVELENKVLLPIGRTNRENIRRKLMQYLR